jgi:ABC-2 type transport system permease protein
MTTEALAPTRNVARIYLLESKYELLRIARVPGFAIPVLLFPAMFYVFFGVLFSRGDATKVATYLLATYGTFGIMSPALFGFGVSTAVERGLGWLRLKRATPMPPLAYFTAKLAAALVFALLVVLTLFALGATAGHVALERWQWLSLAGILVAGAVPFCAIGLAFGSWLGPQSAAPVVNIAYLLSSVLSGLWIPIHMFPKAMHGFANLLPPYHLSQLALRVLKMDQGGSIAFHVGALVAFTVAALVIAAAGFKRSRDGQ